jgi:hypothetical protein
LIDFKIEMKLPENAEKLIDFTVTRKKRTMVRHFSKDTANRPNLPIESKHTRKQRTKHENDDGC